MKKFSKLVEPWKMKIDPYPKPDDEEHGPN